MKLLFLAFVFLIITVTAKAEVFTGSVKHFHGRYVEINRPYSYYALETPEGERIILPYWVDAKRLSQDKGHKLVLEGSLNYWSCTDMSRACPTGELKQVHFLQYDKTQEAPRMELYTGSIKHFKGRAVESSALYDYFAIETGREKIEVPAFIDAGKVMKLKPQVTLVGETIMEACTDMSDACGPVRLHSYSMFQLQF